MRVDDVDAFERFDLRQVQAEGFQRALEFSCGTVRNLCPRLRPTHMQPAFIAILRSPAVHFDVDLLRQFTAQIVHMDTRAAVYKRGIFAGKQSDSQGISSRSFKSARQV